MNAQISERIREERKRLGFANQAQLAERLGISASSVHNYEAGKRSPDADFIAAFGVAGADVLYIITGQRTVTELAPDEAALLENYRAISVERKSNLTDVAAALSLKQQAEKKTG